MKSVKAQWAYDNRDDIDIIDVRTPAEFEMKNIPGAKNIPVVGIIANHDQFLEKGKTYYLQCGSGGRSSKVIEELEAEGYDLINVDGGIGAIKF